MINVPTAGMHAGYNDNVIIIHTLNIICINFIRVIDWL